MAKVMSESTYNNTRNSRPSLTPEAREQKMISLALDLVEQRLRDGTASSQETTHFLKRASIKEQIELERLKAETEMIIAKKESLQSQQRSEEMFREAIDAFRRYSGQSNRSETDEY